MASNDLDDLKRMAAVRAVDLVRSGMVVGLGSGSTAIHLTRLLGERMGDGRLLNVVGVPSSEATARVARESGLPLTTLESHPSLDLAIDGADEVDPSLNLIKGLGGALLREKIVAVASRQVVIVVDHTKRVARLGAQTPVPVEVVRFGWSGPGAHLESLGARVVLRVGPDGAPFVTDEGHLILDAHFGPILDPARLASDIRSRAGVVEHGLFLGIATKVIVAGPEGIKELTR